jgi:hypothetical protein
MKQRTILPTTLFAGTLILAVFLTAPEATFGQEASGKEETATSAPDKKSRGVFHNVFWYIPNRALDVVDIVRARARVGPGLYAGVRVTEVADIIFGSYISVYAGLPGPRGKGRRLPKSPVGLESFGGIGVSVVEAKTEGRIGPGYTKTECGVSLHPILVGIDLGFDPMEILDFATGILLIDLRKDDI